MSQYTERSMDRDDSQGPARPAVVWVQTPSGGAACISDLPADRYVAGRRMPSRTLSLAATRA